MEALAVQEQPVELLVSREEGGMKITALEFARGAKRPLCVATIHVAEGMRSRAAQQAADMRRRKRIPADQCGEKATYMVDEKPCCLRHAQTEALAHVMYLTESE
jgi:hypothetical protein